MATSSLITNSNSEVAEASFVQSCPAERVLRLPELKTALAPPAGPIPVLRNLPADAQAQKPKSRNSRASEEES